MFRAAIAKVNLALAAARAQDPWIVRTARPSPQTSDPQLAAERFFRRRLHDDQPASRHATVNGYPDTIPSTTTAPPRRSSPLRPRLSRAHPPLDAPSLSLRARRRCRTAALSPAPIPYTRISESARGSPGLISSEQPIAQTRYDPDTAHASTPLVGHPSRALQLSAQRLTRRRRHHGSCGPAGQ